jgi:hypothetical protein
MKKALLALLSIAIAFTAMQPSQAQDQKVLAIIDSAVDSNKIPSVIYEACFTTNLSCPNKTNTMEGKGSANSNVWPSSIVNSIYHGHNMTQAALTVDPSIKIVFVRVANVTSSGNILQDTKSLRSAIDWVSKNAEKYSIDAVSVSLSSISKNNLNECTTDSVVMGAVSSLNSKNIPTFAATGNDGSLNVVGYPSCVSGVIGVGASWFDTKTKSHIFAKSTNRGPGLDVLGVAEALIVRYHGTTADTSGTSGATVLAAAKYVSKNTYKTFGEYVSSLPKVLDYPYNGK